MMTGGSYSIGKDRLAAEESVHLRGHSTALLVRGSAIGRRCFRALTVPQSAARKGRSGKQILDSHARQDRKLVENDPLPGR